MQTNQQNDNRQLFGAVLREFTAPLKRIADQANRLIAGEQGALDQAQTEDVRIILQASLRLLGLVDKLAASAEQAGAVAEANSAGTSQLSGGELRSRLLARMSHDLRSPLNSVVGFADLLLQGMEGPLSEKQQQAISAIAQEAQALMELIAEQSRAIGR